jgi:hypothetical protein
LNDTVSIEHTLQKATASIEHTLQKLQLASPARHGHVQPRFLVASLWSTSRF